MAGITLAIAQSHLNYWLDADEKLAGAKVVEINGRQITHADTEAKIQYWDRMVKRLSRGSGVSAHRVVVND